MNTGPFLMKISANCREFHGGNGYARSGHWFSGPINRILILSCSSHLVVDVSSLCYFDSRSSF